LNPVCPVGGRIHHRQCLCAIGSCREVASHPPDLQPSALLRELDSHLKLVAMTRLARALLLVPNQAARLLYPHRNWFQRPALPRGPSAYRAGALLTELHWNKSGWPTWNALRAVQPALSPVSGGGNCTSRSVSGARAIALLVSFHPSLSTAVSKTAGRIGPSYRGMTVSVVI
jgi:hypothetical protein